MIFFNTKFDKKYESYDVFEFEKPISDELSQWISIMINSLGPSDAYMRR